MPRATRQPFTLEPLDKLFVPPKPKNSAEEGQLESLEREGVLILTRKRDGHYLTAVLGKEVRLYTRGLVKDVTANFPHIVAELSRIRYRKRSEVLCGEVYFERHGKDDREFIASLTSRSAEEAIRLQRERGRASFMVFNVLVHAGENVAAQWTNAQRLQLIESKFQGLTCVRPVEVLKCSLAEAMASAVREGWEGLVTYHALKKSGFRLDGNEDSPVRPDGCWKKKPSYEDDFVVTGWKLGTKGKRHSHRVGKLFIAQYGPGGELIPCGEVGIGLNDDMRNRLANDSLYPFVAEVRFERRFAPRAVKKREVQCALCFPCFVRVRTDKAPTACRLPENLAQATLDMKGEA